MEEETVTGHVPRSCRKKDPDKEEGLKDHGDQISTGSVVRDVIAKR